MDLTRESAKQQARLATRASAMEGEDAEPRLTRSHQSAGKCSMKSALTARKCERTSTVPSTMSVVAAIGDGRRKLQEEEEVRVESAIASGECLPGVGRE